MNSDVILSIPSIDSSEPGVTTLSLLVGLEDVGSISL